MKYTEMPDCDYRLVRKVEADGPQAFIDFLQEIPSETPVAWYSHKDEEAHPGVWVSRGRYRLKHGSFVDPSDLSAYPAQYYEPFARGRHEAVQIGRTPKQMAAPADVTPVSTVDDLITALHALVPEIVQVEADAEVAEIAEPIGGSEEKIEEDMQDGATVEAEGAGAVGSSARTAAELVAELKFLQPDYAFEFHGALTRGWHGQYYVALGEDDEVKAELVVLR